MRENFPEYLKLTEAEVAKLWQDAIFVFDTSALLGLYRIEPKLRKKFFSILKKLKNKLWMPHQVGLEFSRGRISVMCMIESDFGKSFEYFRQAKNKVLDSPVTTKEVSRHKELKKLFESLEEICEDLGSKPSGWQSEDDILKFIEEVYKEKIGAPYSEERKLTIFEEGEKRYKVETPPGYKDQNKDKGDKTGQRKFGDLLVWFQIIDKAKEINKPMILVTGERKEDWWWHEDSGDHNIGARPELIKEFKDKSKQIFFMYELGNFLKIFAKVKKEKEEKQLIKKIQELKEQEGAADVASSPGGLEPTDLTSAPEPVKEESTSLAASSSSSSPESELINDLTTNE